MEKSFADIQIPPIPQQREEESFQQTEKESIMQFHNAFNATHDDEYDFTVFDDTAREDVARVPTQELRRSERTRRPNPRYYNVDLQN